MHKMALGPNFLNRVSCLSDVVVMGEGKTHESNAGLADIFFSLAPQPLNLWCPTTKEKSHFDGHILS